MRQFKVGLQWEMTFHAEMTVTARDKSDAESRAKEHLSGLRGEGVPPTKHPLIQGTTLVRCPELRGLIGPEAVEVTQVTALPEVTFEPGERERTPLTVDQLIAWLGQVRTRLPRKGDTNVRMADGEPVVFVGEEGVGVRDGAPEGIAYVVISDRVPGEDS